MIDIKFKIIEKPYDHHINSDGKKYPGDDADFYLEEDSWNDYYYFVTYYIHATKRITKGKHILLGSIKVMKKGQTINQKYLLRQFVGTLPFEELPDDFVSICFEEKFYLWLREMPIDYRKSVCFKLHLIINEQSSFFKLVENDDCFRKALLRDVTMDNYILQNAGVWLFDEERRYNLRKQSFEIQYNDCDCSIPLKFSFFSDFEDHKFPNGIIAFIGENGSGKSTALYKLAKLMYLYPNKRDCLRDCCGSIIPNDLGVDQMMLISYSPFDNFVVPNANNYAQHYYEIPNNAIKSERFIYCGIRNMDAERNGSIFVEESEMLTEARQIKTILKSQDELADDFAFAIDIIRNDFNLFDTELYSWDTIAENAQTFYPELSQIMNNIMHFKEHKQIVDYFKILSTGYKYCLHSLAYVIAFVCPGTLFLFDEPENHIHPPLLSFMMTQFRMILSNYDSVMLVSTHSPVILQELFSCNVFKVERYGDRIVLSHPRIETFGASFGEINAEVFNLTTDKSQYYDVFDRIYEEWELDTLTSVKFMLNRLYDRMNNVFNQRASDISSQGISPKMISYFINKYCSNHKIN